MKKTVCIMLILIITAGILCGCGASGATSDGTDSVTSQTGAPSETGNAETSLEDRSGNAAADKTANEFTEKIRLESDFVEFCVPEDHEGNLFKDMGVNCAVTVDRYDNDVAAYHEYDSYGTVEKKTVGDYTFDYQKFNYMDIPDWRIYVIRIVRNHEYYRFLYNVYSSEYDDGQVEKFMETIRFFS